MKLIIIFLLFFLIFSGCGVSTKIIYEKSLQDVEREERKERQIQEKPKTVRKIPNEYDTMIQAIVIEGELSTSKAMVLWDSYKKTSFINFYDYLIEKNPYEKVDRIYKDFVIRVKMRTKLIKRGIK